MDRRDLDGAVLILQPELTAGSLVKTMNRVVEIMRADFSGPPAKELLLDLRQSSRERALVCQAGDSSQLSPLSFREIARPTHVSALDLPNVAAVPRRVKPVRCNRELAKPCPQRCRLSREHRRS